MVAGTATERLWARERFGRVVYVITASPALGAGAGLVGAAEVPIMTYCCAGSTLETFPPPRQGRAAGGAGGAAAGALTLPCP